MATDTGLVASRSFVAQEAVVRIIKGRVAVIAAVFQVDGNPPQTIMVQGHDCLTLMTVVAKGWHGVAGGTITGKSQEILTMGVIKIRRVNFVLQLSFQMAIFALAGLVTLETIILV